MCGDQDKVIEAQAKRLDDQAVELKNMKTESEDQGKQILDLMNAVKDLQKEKEPNTKPAEKKKGK